jgi:hypothetical protein
MGQNEPRGFLYFLRYPSALENDSLVTLRFLVAVITGYTFRVSTFLHNGRIYLTQSIVWVDYKEEIDAQLYDRSTLSVRFSDGTTCEIQGQEATNQLVQLEESLGVSLR